ncbi:MAG: hypothetical protein ACRDZW_10475 [Acidimicrobiales bacterium]
MVGAGRPYLLVRDLELDLPRRPAAREVRGEALWAAVNCETAHEHWSVGLEAFGVAMDDPDEALGQERGDRIGLGLDLEWESASPLLGGAGGYEQSCQVHGEVLVGVGASVETVAVAGHGWRRHAWGAVDWSAPRWTLRGRGDDGVPVVADTAVATPVRPLHRAPLRLGDGPSPAVLERTLVALVGSGGTGWVEEVRPGPR